MKKIKGIFLILFALSLFACKTSSDSDDGKEEQTTSDTTEVSGTEGSTDNPSQPAQGQTTSVKSAQYFWGTWQRMDKGDYYTIGESSVDFSDTSYSITSAGEDFLTVSTLGTFTKQTGSVMVNNSIPYFRKGGTNLEYTMKLVGFEEDLSRTARAASSTSLAGYTVTGKSDKYGSYESTSASESDGSVTLTAPVKGDTQTVTVTSGSTTITVVPGIKVETNGSNMGTIPISQEGQYSLKLTGTIDESEKDDGYLYGNNYKSYPMTLTITNVSDVVSAPSVCTITAEDSRVTVSSADGSDITGGVLISTLKSGFTKTIPLSVTCGTLTESYLDTGLIVTVKNAATEKTWQDYVPLRFFKGLVPITVAAESVEENADAALNGFVIYPDGNSQFFSVPDKGDKTIYVPTFGSDQPYTLAFSGATIEGTLSKSTEMLYTVASGTWTKKEINTAATPFINAVQYGETGSGNGSEDNATVADSEFEAYLADGDVDFYEMLINNSDNILPNQKRYRISFINKKGENPETIYVMLNSYLPMLPIPSSSELNFVFRGWYINDMKISSNFIVNENLTLNAEWVYGTIVTESDIEKLDLQIFSEDYTVFMKGAMTGKAIASALAKIEKSNSTVCLDMSEAEISINELNQTLGLQKCKNIKKITFWKNLTAIDSYVFQDNDSLEAIEFSDNINSNGLKIDKYAFYNCSNLKKVVFPLTSGWLNLGVSAFANCSKLQHILFNGTKSQLRRATSPDWHNGVPATKIICSDEEVDL